MRKFVFAAAILLLLTNVVVLAGVAYNRSGVPVVSIDLTERELPIQPSFGITDESSATALSIEWKTLDRDKDPRYMFSTYGTPAWLDEKKLVELGFDIEQLKGDTERYRYRTSHWAVEAILVLEHDGDAYSQALSLAETRQVELRRELDNNPDDEDLAERHKIFSEQLARLKQSQSRLYVIDAGLDLQALSDKYADKGNHLFLRGEIGLQWAGDAVEGRIRQLSIQEIHVPLPFSRTLSELAGEVGYYSYQTPPIPPRYTVQLHIGNRLEPWVASVTQRPDHH